MAALQLVDVPAGPFTRGTGGRAEESPEVLVHLDAYRICRFPVTNLEYQDFLSATPSQAPPEYWRGTTAPADRLDHPVVEVTWDDANAFAAWTSRQTGQSYRLPTEAEWEKAARGNDGRTYPWGNTFDSTRCNTREEGPGHTTAIHAYPLGHSAFGIADMAGNVSEWCADWYQDGYEPGVERNPSGPDNGEFRVIRGSSWRYSADLARCSARYWCPPDVPRDNTGFRLVCTRADA